MPLLLGDGLQLCIRGKHWNKILQAAGHAEVKSSFHLTDDLYFSGTDWPKKRLA
jgi:hypothetical protein